jgi:two-component system, sensor histidine kinase
MLLDMEMPGLSGPETARQLRAQEMLHESVSLPILALTANTRPEAVEACLAAGMNGHLSKPFDHQDLHDAIARLLRRAA